MGLLWAVGNRKDSDYPLPVDNEEPEIKVDGIPYYLAYFQRSFDLERERLKEKDIREDLLDVKNKYFRYYFNEGNVDEDMRKKWLHAYKLDRVPAYRKIFRLRQKADEEERARYIKQDKEGEK